MDERRQVRTGLLDRIEAGEPVDRATWQRCMLIEDQAWSAGPDQVNGLIAETLGAAGVGGVAALSALATRLPQEFGWLKAAIDGIAKLVGLA